MLRSRRHIRTMSVQELELLELEQKQMLAHRSHNPKVLERLVPHQQSVL